MNSTPDPKETEPRDAPTGQADERLAHAHEQITRADEQLTRLSEQLAKMERDAARPSPAGTGPQSPPTQSPPAQSSAMPSPPGRRRCGPPWACCCCWRRASLSLPWFCNRPMAAGPALRHSSLQCHHRRRKIRRYPRSPHHPPFKWPQRRQHQLKQRHRKQPRRRQHAWLRPHRKTPRRKHPQRLPIKRSCCKRSRAISRIWSEPSNSSRRTSSKPPATVQKPLGSSGRPRKR